MPSTTAERDISRAMSALSHPRRVAIMSALEETGAGGLGFSGLTERTGIQASTLRHHLRPMEEAGLVVRTRKGAVVRYHLHGMAVIDAASGVAKRLSAINRPRSFDPAA